MFKASLFTLGVAISCATFGQVSPPEVAKFDPIQHAATIKNYYTMKEPAPGRLFLSIVEHNLTAYKDQLSADDYAMLQAESKKMRKHKAEVLQQVFELVAKVSAKERYIDASKEKRPDIVVDVEQSLSLVARIEELDKQFNKNHSARILGKLSDPAQQLFHGTLLPKLAKSASSMKLQWHKLAEEQPQLFQQMQSQMFEHVRRMKSPEKAKVVYFETPPAYSSEGKAQDQVGMMQTGYKVVESQGDEQ